MKGEQLRLLWKTAFGDGEEWISSFFSTAYSPDRCVTVREGERIAAALYWLDCEYAGQRLAYMYAVATHPDFRGRGMCRELMEKTHARLTELGYAGSLLMPAEEDLRKMYAKMGYTDCCNVSEFACFPAAPVPLRRISRGEYACLRRKFLPEGGVIQEGESLAFLETYARFYAGKDFLLAASADGKQLSGVELLGNRDAAPGILGTLGYETGRFRIPGEEIPFAMFRPLRPGVKRPKYLGLVFD